MAPTGEIGTPSKAKRITGTGRVKWNVQRLLQRVSVRIPQKPMVSLKLEPNTNVLLLRGLLIRSLTEKQVDFK